MNSVLLTDNNSIAQIGAGNRWHHVFEELEKTNVTVPGGRTGSVGVGGLTLGGNIVPHIHRSLQKLTYGLIRGNFFPFRSSWICVRQRIQL